MGQPTSELLERLEQTRRSLHGVAELLLAGPQYAVSRSIELRVRPGGFGTVAGPDLRVDGLELVTPTARLPLGGTFAELAIAAGVQARRLRDVYDDGPDVDEDDPIDVDPDATSVLLHAFVVGDGALRSFASDQVPVLWPEHFDVGITREEVNYGVSPGDGKVPAPYAYVGPWKPRAGSFWNRDFGAARTLDELGDQEALEAFFRQGAARALTDPPRQGVGRTS